MLLEAGKRVGRERYVERILAAPPLPFPDFNRVSNAIKAGGAVDEDSRWSFERTKLELFYRRPVTAALIADDRNGLRRRRIMQFDAIERAAAGNVPDRDRIRQQKAAYRKAGWRVSSEAREALERALAEDDPDQPLDRRAMFIRHGDEAALAIMRLIQFTPVLKGASWDADTVFDGDALGDFARFAAANKAALENQLGIEVRQDLAAKPVSQLKSVLRLVGLDLVKAGTVKAGGRKFYRYALDGDALKAIKSVLADRERTTGWRFMAELHGWAKPDDDDDEHVDDDAA